MDFLYVVNHISELESTEMIQDINSTYKYPVGILFFLREKKKIKIYFVHYQSFDEAKTKFYKRVGRINENVVVLLTIRELTYEIYEEFKKVPFKKYVFMEKVLFL